MFALSNSFLQCSPFLPTLRTAEGKREDGKKKEEPNSQIMIVRSFCVFAAAAGVYNETTYFLWDGERGEAARGEGRVIGARSSERGRMCGARGKGEKWSCRRWIKLQKQKSIQRKASSLWQGGPSHSGTESHTAAKKEGGKRRKRQRRREYANSSLVGRGRKKKPGVFASHLIPPYPSRRLEEAPFCPLEAFSPFRCLTWNFCSR